MLSKSDIEKIQENANKPSFCKFLSRGENWKSKSMRMIPEEFVRSTHGSFKHRVVLSDCWGSSWQLWIEQDKKGLLLMIEEDWDEFVDDNLLSPNDALFFHHQDTMFLRVHIFHKDDKGFISSSLEPEYEPFYVKPMSSHEEVITPFASLSASASASASGSSNGRVKPSSGHVVNPELYLQDSKSPYFVKIITKRNDVLYVSRPAIQKYGLKFGHVDSEMNYFLPGGKVEVGRNKIYGKAPCFSGWFGVCRKHGFKLGDNLVCELERSGDGVVTAVRVHLVK